MDPELSLFSGAPLKDETAGDIANAVPKIRKDLAIIALGEIQGVGQTTAVKLYDSPHFDSLFTASRDEVYWIASTSAIDRPHAFADTFVSNRDEAIERANDVQRELVDDLIELILDTDERYPETLRSIPDGPRWLFVRGNHDLLSSPRLITVVGTREASTYGKNLARRVTGLLVRNGFVVVAGLADGIDAIVHEEVLRLKGQTIGVLGTGIHNLFPQATAKLRGPMIARGGAIVTEYFDKEQYSKQRFVQRNRIQAALSQITIPVEASVPSGTLHTVRFAKQYGRMVLGVKFPGVSDTPLHALLREEGFQVVDVPEADDPFMSAVGTRYDYADFRLASEVERRNALVKRAIQSIRALVRNEGLGELDLKRIIDGIRYTDDG